MAVSNELVGWKRRRFMAGSSPAAFTIWSYHQSSRFF